MARGMRPEHRAAMARARADHKAVRDYLEALHSNQRLSKRAIASVLTQLDRVEGELRDASPIEELLLLQEHRDLESELHSMSSPVDMDALESAFVAVAARYGSTRGIGYATWRELGVDVAVLAAAGIRPSSP